MTRIVGVTALSIMFFVGMTGIASADDVQLTAQLSGTNEVDNPGDSDGTGSAVVDIDSDTAQVCFQITVSGTEDPVAAHIHEGAAGTNGGIVVDFEWATNNSAGCVAGDANIVSAILSNPAGYYVNVHTPEFPPGAVRGQLAAAAAAPATELAVTGSNLTVILLFAAGALLIAGIGTRMVSPRLARP